MKRSEALNIIDGVLLEHDCPLLQGIDKEILGRLERAGMLPPSVCIREDGSWDSAKHAAHFHMHKDTHYWEDEDA